MIANPFGMLTFIVAPAIPHQRLFRQPWPRQTGYAALNESCDFDSIDEGKNKPKEWLELYFQLLIRWKASSCWFGL